MTTADPLTFNAILNSTHHILGRELYVDKFKEQVDLVSAQQNYINRRITVSKIHLSLSEADLKRHFRKFGEIESVLFLSERDGSASSQTAQIIFFEQSGAEKSKRHKHHVISSHKVFVKITESKNEKRQKQILSQAGYSTQSKIATGQRKPAPTIEQKVQKISNGKKSNSLHYRVSEQQT